MRTLIITSCTGEKASSPGNQFVLEDFVRGRAHLPERENELMAFPMPAGEVYTGQQHVRLRRGIEAVKHTEGLEINAHGNSVGYGLIPRDRSVLTCDCAFATMWSKELREYNYQLEMGSRTRRKGCWKLIWIQKLVEIAEAAASVPADALLKPSNERHVTTKTYDNPVFVEDSTRNAAFVLNQENIRANYALRGAFVALTSSNFMC